MTILILEDMPTGFRGELTQWLLEIKAGVYIGNVSASIRELLWNKVKNNTAKGSALIIYSASNEQGFLFDTVNTPERYVVDIEGINLIGRKFATER